MPNWVRNKLTVTGKNPEEFISAHCTLGEENEPQFDFNKIIPMPESLNIICGSITDSAAGLYLTSINPKVSYYGDAKLSYGEFKDLLGLLRKSNPHKDLNYRMTETEIKRLKETFKGRNDFGEMTPLEYGKRAIENVQKYGFMDWNGWAYANWGVKCNGCNTSIYENAVYFDTPWSSVAGLMKKLSENNPGYTFNYTYAEEQPGYFAGTVEFKNGKVLNCNAYETDSVDAFKTFFELWGCEDDFFYDEKGKTYRYKENEEEME